jgi:hypothetical protein
VPFSARLSTGERCAYKLGEARSAYLLSLRVAGCSSRTVDNRTRILDVLQRFVGEDLGALDRARLVEFFETFRSAGRKPQTVHTYVNIVHRFLRWCVDAGWAYNEWVRARPRRTRTHKVWVCAENIGHFRLNLRVDRYEQARLAADPSVKAIDTAS